MGIVRLYATVDETIVCRHEVGTIRVLYGALKELMHVMASFVRDRPYDAFDVLARHDRFCVCVVARDLDRDGHGYDFGVDDDVVGTGGEQKIKEYCCIGLCSGFMHSCLSGDVALCYRNYQLTHESHLSFCFFSLIVGIFPEWEIKN